VDVTIENTSGGTVQDVRYTRTMDWDVEPTAFSEFVTIQGTASTSTLLYSSDNGFLSADPFGSRSEIMSGTTDVDFTDFGPEDHGAHFDFGFGDLLEGESYSFQIFYGAAPTESAALGAIGAAGLELFSLGQSDDGGEVTGEPATHIFGFKGVGGEVQIEVPEGDTAIAAGLVGVLAGVGYFRRKRA
jgi:type IV pilus assembly protein PilY1